MNLEQLKKIVVPEILAVKVDYQTTFIVWKEKYQDFLDECRICGQTDEEIEKFEVKELDLTSNGWDEI